MRRQLLTSFILLLAFHSFTQRQIEIQGPDVLPFECCADYFIQLQDTVGSAQPSTWTITDNSGNTILTKDTYGPHRINFCPGEFNPLSGIVIITVEIPHLDLIVTKTVLLTSNFFEIIGEHDCFIEERGNRVTVCEGSTGIYFVETNVQTIDWHVDGGTIIQTDWNNITVLWDQPGLGSVTAFYFDSLCPQDAFIEILVLPHPEAHFDCEPTLSTSRELQVCLGQNIQFINTSKDALNYIWDFGDGRKSHLENPEHAYNQPGQYFVTLITPNGCECTDTTTATIEVLPDRAAALTCIGTVCPNEESTYYVESDCDEIIWTVSGNGQVVNGGGLKDKFITVSWAGGPKGQVTVQGQNCPAGFCNAPNAFTVPVISYDGPIEGDQEVCIDDIRTYSAPFFQGTEYGWTISTGGRIIGSNSSQNVTVLWFSPPAPGKQHFVRVVYENCYLECGGLDSIAVDVLTRFNIRGPGKICENQTITVDAFDTDRNQTVSCTWEIRNEKGDIIESSGLSSTVFTSSAILSPGRYTILGRASKGQFCEEVEVLHFEVISAPPKPNAILGDMEICLGHSYVYEIDQYKDEYNVIWTIDDGGNLTKIEGSSLLNYRWTTTGPYSVTAAYKTVLDPSCESEDVSISPSSAVFNVIGSTEACHESISILSTSNKDLPEYIWSVSPHNAGHIVSGQGTSEVEIYWTSVGNHEIQLTACGLSQSHFINVTDVEKPEVIHPSTLCAGDVRKVSLRQLYDKVVWKDIDNNFIGSDRVAHIGPGTYYVIVESIHGCSDSTFFTIDKSPVPEALISINEVRAFCENEPFSARRLFANTTGAYTYQWYKDGLPVGTNSSTFDATEFGSYHVVTSNAFNCSSLSNTITLIKDCDGGAGGTCSGNCRKVTCPDTYSLAFNTTDDPVYCNVKTFTNASSHTLLNYKWIVEDLENSGWIDRYDAILNYTFPSAGFYTVILDGEILLPGGIPDSCITNEVEIVEVPVAANFSSLPVCAGESMTFDDLSTYLPGRSIVNWEWDFGDPTSGANNTSNAQRPDHQYLSSGRYWVTLTVTANTGCIATITKEVEVQASPIPDFSLTTPVCVGSSVEVNSSNDHFEIQWAFNDPRSSEDSTSSKTSFYTYDSAGVYDIDLHVRDKSGCVNMITKQVDVVPPPGKQAVTLIGSNPLCLWDSVLLEAPMADSYIWSNGATTRDIYVKASGDYKVKVHFSNGCSFETDPVTITVNSPPSVQIIGSHVDASGVELTMSTSLLDICQGDRVVFNSISTNKNLDYEWSDGNKVAGNINRVLPLGTHVFSLIVTDRSTGCRSTSNEITVNVYPYPTRPNISADKNQPICEGEQVHLEVTNFNPAYGYLWSNGERGNSIDVTSAGDYFVTAIGQGGCSTASSTVRIWPVPNAEFVLTGCYDICARDTFCMPSIPNAALYQWYKDGIAIPAPRGDQKNLVFDETGEYYVEVTSAQGCASTSGTLQFNVEPGRGDVIINVYFDVNQNGVIDAGDTLISDIELTSRIPSSTRKDTTNDDGQVIWKKYTEGEYLIDITDNRYDIIIGSDTINIFGCDEVYEVNLLVGKNCQTVFSQVDTTICAVDTIFIAKDTITTSGTHQVTTQTLKGCDSIITVTVTNAPVDNYRIDTFLCNRDSVFFGNRSIYDEGTYTHVDTNSYGCIEVTELHLQRTIDRVSLDTTVCQLDTLLLYDSLITSAGTHQFDHINQSGCLEEVTVNVTLDNDESDIDIKVYLDINQDGIIDARDSPLSGIPIRLILRGGLPQFGNTNGSGICIFNDLINGEYKIVLDTTGWGSQFIFSILEHTITLDECGEDASFVFIIQQVPQVFIPNVFTPDGDQLNDGFRVYTRWPDDIILKLSIYDRWGELVFSFEGEGDQKEVTWDGRLNGRDMDPAVFVYVAEVRHRNGEVGFYSGDVTLMR